MELVAKSYMRKGFLMYEEMRKYLVIYWEATSHNILIYGMNLQLLPSAFPNIWGKFYLIFYQCTYKNIPHSAVHTWHRASLFAFYRNCFLFLLYTILYTVFNNMSHMITYSHFPPFLLYFLLATYLILTWTFFHDSFVTNFYFFL